MQDEREAAQPEGNIKTDKEAQELADTPQLTGDPEWDAIEMAETGAGQK